MKLKLYCIHYTPVIGGGVNNPVIMKLDEKKATFDNELVMLECLARLKLDDSIADIHVSTFYVSTSELYQQKHEIKEENYE